MTTTLTHAFNQWSTRPADERFKSLVELDAAVRQHRANSVEKRNVEMRKLRVVPSNQLVQVGQVVGDSRPMLQGETGTVADFTHYSFGQLARRIGAPANYLRSLPVALACECMNEGLQHIEPRENGEGDNLLFQRNGALTLRAALTPSYTRIWNSDITSRLIRLADQTTFQPAPEAFDGSRGLYASDKDMFAFLVDNTRRIFEKDPNGGLGRGFFVSNSEVGDASFRLTTFFYEYVCGNHRVWGAQGVTELRIPHKGSADDKAFAGIALEVKKYAEASAIEDERKVTAMKTRILGASKDDVLDAVFNLGVSRKTAQIAYAIAEKSEDRYGNPNSVWGFTGGLTEVARDLPNADERVKLERQAGKIMEIAF